MKKIIILYIIIVVSQLNVHSQQCVNEVNTHPDHEPRQSHYDALPADDTIPDERFLNGWEWWYDHDPQSSNSIPLNNMGLTPPRSYTIEPSSWGFINY